MHNCEEDMYTLEPITRDYVSAGDGLCMNCSTVRGLLKINPKDYKKNALQYLFQIEGENKLLENDVKDQILKKCNIINSEAKLNRVISTLPVSTHSIQNPTREQISFLMSYVNRSDQLCMGKLSTYILETLHKKDIRVIYSNDKNVMRSLIISTIIDVENVNIEVICGSYKGDGFKMFKHFKDTYAIPKKFKFIQLHSIRDNTGKLVNTYKRWGFRTASLSNCESQCHMIAEI